MIPQADPRRTFDEVRDEIFQAMQRVFDGGMFILGPETEAFEVEFAEFLGIPHAVGVSSGTDAVALALVAAGLKPGDEVITVSMTAVATALGIRDAGGVPKFVDVDPATRCMDPNALAAAVGPRTAAIVPVHLHGVPADMDAILQIARQKGLLVIEDCAQAHGAKYRGRTVGTFGHAAAFSFFPTKNLGAAGDGGAVVTADPGINERLRRMRSYGWDANRVTVGPGTNRRLDELQASILRILLPRLDNNNRERQSIAAQFRDCLEGLPIELPVDHDGAVYHQFAIGVDNRDEVRRFAASRGLQTGSHYPLGIHQQPYFSDGAPGLPVTERLASRLMSLPIQPEIARNQVAHISQIIAAGVRECARS